MRRATSIPARVALVRAAKDARMARGLSPDLPDEELDAILPPPRGRRGKRRRVDPPANVNARAGERPARYRAT